MLTQSHGGQFILETMTRFFFLLSFSFYTSRKQDRATTGSLRSAG